MMDVIVTEKRCTQCKEVKQVSEFYKNRPECKICHAKTTKKWYHANFEKVSKLVRKWSIENPEKVRDASRKWARNHPDKVKEHGKQQYHSNSEKRKVSSAAWLKANYERVSEKSKKRYIANTEKIKAQNKLWRKNNLLKCRIISHNRRSLFKGTYSEEEWNALCKKYDNKCLCCGEEKKLTTDHVIPVSKGGSNTIDNLQPLCISCNCKKYTKTIDYRR